MDYFGFYLMHAQDKNSFEKYKAIPDLFSLLNAKRIWNNWNTEYYYHNISTKEGARAKDCLECGACEGICPQHLQIRELLKEVSGEFDK